MSREEVMEIIRQANQETGRVPTFKQLMQAKRLTQYDIRKHFGVYAAALNACGLEGTGSGYDAGLRNLFNDWVEVTRRVGRVPTVGDYELHSRYSLKPLMKQFGTWHRVAPAMAQYAREHHLEENGKDVLQVVEDHLHAQERRPLSMKLSSKWTSKSALRPLLRPGLMPGEPIYGPPTVDAHLLFAPTNEQGVLILFGAVARKLGFVVLRSQSEFPDCEALREMEIDKWQLVRIEFEWESRNFLLHKHRAEKCHLIVCWKHNWEECPVEVIELSSAIKQIG